VPAQACEWPQGGGLPSRRHGSSSWSSQDLSSNSAGEWEGSSLSVLFFVKIWELGVRDGLEKSERLLLLTAGQFLATYCSLLCELYSSS
jgi:hypothetical protein